MMPSIKMWIDVRNLDDVGLLEKCVSESMAVLVFLSNEYFKSFNCRREIATALPEEKPLILVHEADESKGGASLQTQLAKAHCKNYAPTFASEPARTRKHRHTCIRT